MHRILFALPLTLALVGFTQDDVSQRVKELVPILGNDDPDVRIKASMDLRALGRAALPHLRDAFKAETDAEIKARLEELIHRYEEIEWRTGYGDTLKASAELKKPLLIYSAGGAVATDS